MGCGRVNGTPATKVRTRFVILGGYLGAGKSTLAASLAKRLRDKHGKSVAIITNDQGDVLVDTEYMRSAGIDVREVLGGCFCSHFDEFVKSARSLVQMDRPDIIIAEPIGTSTNIMATVVIPLRDMYPDEFEVAPLFVVVDGTKAIDLLAPSTGFGLGGGRLIPSHQVHEAEVIVISKADLIGKAELSQVMTAVRKEVPDAQVLACSARTGLDLDGLENVVLSGVRSHKAASGTDQRLFNTEKATMGWYSGVSSIRPSARLDVYDLAMTFMKELAKRYDPSSIGHVKLIYTSDSSSLKMSLVGDSVQVDGIKGGRYSEGEGRLIANARIMAPPAQIRKDMESALKTTCASLGLELVEHKGNTISPKPEVPDHYLMK
jgi:G3E family GTPase